jgi:hypothetical protein
MRPPCSSWMSNRSELLTVHRGPERRRQSVQVSQHGSLDLPLFVSCGAAHPANQRSLLVTGSLRCAGGIHADVVSPDSHLSPAAPRLMAPARHRWAGAAVVLIDLSNRGPLGTKRWLAVSQAEQSSGAAVHFVLRLTPKVCDGGLTSLLYASARNDSSSRENRHQPIGVRARVPWMTQEQPCRIRCIPFMQPGGSHAPASHPTTRAWAGDHPA